jgi:hypothetical protein
LNVGVLAQADSRTVAAMAVAICSGFMAGS